MKLQTPDGHPVRVHKTDIVVVNGPSVGQSPGTWDEDGEYAIRACIVLRSGTEVTISDDSYRKLQSKGF
jgi:hypothetical protein